jgi:peroxiredoxin-like protein
MEETHQYQVVAWWTSGRTGIAKSRSAQNAIHFTAPAEFGGLEGRWTPEDLLLGALASCYTTTFRALAEHSRFEYADLEVEVQGIVHKADSGYRFSEIIIRPNLTISSEAGLERALLLLQKADALCLVARTLSIHQTFESRVQVTSRFQRRDRHMLPAAVNSIAWQGSAAAIERFIAPGGVKLLK